MRRHVVGVSLAGFIGVLVVCGVAFAAKPKPLGFYCAKFDCLQVNSRGKTLSFQGRCTAVKHPKFLFEAFFVRAWLLQDDGEVAANWPLLGRGGAV